MRPVRPLAYALAAVLALAVAPDRPAASADDKKDPPPVKLPTEAEIMAAKLKHSQALIDALAREDFPKLEEHATALVRISNGAEFLNAHKTEEYALQARLFRRAAATLAERAHDRRLEGALLAYLEMSVSCVKCHQYTRTRKRD
jgi:hypothetical protein